MCPGKLYFRLLGSERIEIKIEVIVRYQRATNAAGSSQCDFRDSSELKDRSLCSGIILYWYVIATPSFQVLKFKIVFQPGEINRVLTATFC